MSINDEFVVRCKISPFIGVASLVRVRLIPQDVPPIEGYRIKEYYELSSEYLNGPKKDSIMITHVPLNTLHLAPGTYKVEIYYSELTGFGFRSSSPQMYEIELHKDTLEVLSNERFSEPLEDGFAYGAVYTFEYNINGTLSWAVIYDGQIVNSLREPVQLDNVSLFIEENDRYKNIANVSTDNEGKFYLNYIVYGSIEQNLLVQIKHQGSEFFKPLIHVEYAGLETPILDQRFFKDEDFDGFPDWKYSLHDLLKVFSSYSESVPSSSLAFMAEFSENEGSTTTEFINDLEGTIEGNTSWIIGKRDSALLFDGDGIVSEGGGGNDFKVISGTTVISSGQTTITITEGTDYTLESGVNSSSAFIRITNTRLTGMGTTSGGGNQNNDDFCVWIQNPGNINTSITFERTGIDNDDRVTWEILQYIGPEGGANEFIVRNVGTATCSGTTQTVDGSTISTISDSDKIAIFITGQKAVDTGTGNWHESLFTAELINVGGGDYKSQFKRGNSVSSDDGVSYAVIEFTGSNWRDVQRLEISTECSTEWTTSNYNTAYTDVTIQSEGGVDLLNYSRAFMHQQFRTDCDATGIDDAGD
ncbi:MAG: hypothetical protein ACFFG0_47695, partial [Candidatus Thorarchaeota archaeon]